MEKIHGITPFKGGAVATNNKGQIVNVYKGKTYKILGDDNQYHKAKYIGGKNYVEKKTIGGILKKVVELIIALFK